MRSPALGGSFVAAERGEGGGEHDQARDGSAGRRQDSSRCGSRRGCLVVPLASVSVGRPPREAGQHHQAITRLETKLDFKTHVVVYVMVNALLITIWAMSGFGYFWPIWPIFGWGIGLASHAYAVYFQRPISEGQIQAEMRRNHPSHPQI